MLFKPQQISFVFFDAKKVTFSLFKKIPNLLSIDEK